MTQSPTSAMTKQARQKSPSPLYQRLLLVLAMLFASLSLAEPLFESSKSNPLLQQPDFLPVTEAYQLSATQQNGHLQLQWQLADGYYLYKHRFTFLHPETNSPLNVDPLYSRQGKAVYDEFYQRELEVFYNSVDISLQGLPDKQPSPQILVQSQACADAGLCYPPRSQLVTLPPLADRAQVTEGGLPASMSIPASTEPASPESRPKLLLIITFALLGGLILNLMPCVFPVLSIKVLSLTAHHQSPQKRLLHGLWYSLGVIVSFVVIALLLLLLRSAGEAIGWGFQLQSPVFVTVLIYLFILMGLSFSGVFYMGSRLMNFGQSATDDTSLTASFMTGVLAAVIASPCSAPFMGTALGFALTQPAATSLALFSVLGLGMALPFLILSAWPGLSNKIPKPGQWMDSLKQFLAFPLYLSAVWLIWVLGRQTSSDVVAAVITGIVLLIFAIWITHHSNQHKQLARACACLALLGAILLPWNTYHQQTQPANHLWEAYSAQRLEQLISQGDAVFVNLTADWCITCLTNEATTLNQDDVQQAFRTNGIYYLKGDWTRYDPAITELLNSHQRSGVPLYLFYPPNQGTPIILPQLLTKNIILTAFSAE